MAKKQMKRCSISLTIRELQIQTTVRYYCTHIRMTKIHNNDALTAGGKVCIANGTVKWYSLLWKAVWQFLIKLSICILYELAIPFLGIYSKEMKTRVCTNACTRIFIKPLVIVASTGNSKNVYQLVSTYINCGLFI